jgi:flagellar motor switch/type III secretory pathway protein FliN
MSEQSHPDPVAWTRVEQLSCELKIEIPVAQFEVNDLLRMHVGTVLDSKWHAMKEVPLEVNGRQVAWCEFEVVGKRLGVRIAELR